MSLSNAGWIDGLTASGIVIFACTLGLFVIYQAKKTNANLLFSMGLVILFSGFAFLGVFLDFLIVITTNNNMNNTYGMVGLISFVWIAPLLVLVVYVATELMVPEKKWYIVGVYIIIAVIFELILFLDPYGSLDFIYPEHPGENLIDYNLKPFSLAGILMLFSLISITIFLGFGCIIKAFRSTGVIRKKFFLISLGTFLYAIFGFLESSTVPGALIIFIRFGYSIGPFVMYLGLREEPEQKEKIKPQKEVRIEGDLFRISQFKKGDINEEEVSISKEKKICLVCKGKAIEFNIYLCPKCETFYCAKCARALIELENMCWACGGPIDKSKPVKPLVKEEEVIVEEKNKKNLFIKKQ